MRLILDYNTAMIPASEALDRLREGNLRFASGTGSRDLAQSQVRRASTIERQQPFAVILGCADSRAPVELVFDQDLGDLFVIRVAGNIVARTQIGSVEFAAEQFGTRLVVVLGHSHCGAVKSTVAALQRPAADASPNLEFIVDRIRPAIESTLSEYRDADPDELVDKAVRANVRHAVAELQHGSSIIESLANEQGLEIVGACYSLETGRVEFLD